MNDPIPNQDATRAIEALDRCLARMRRGLPLERVGSDAPDQAPELAPLLVLAQNLTRWGAQPIPAPPSDLRPGRARFLDAAAKVVDGRSPITDDATEDRLDAAVAQLAAGRSPEEALVHLNGDREAMRPLVQLADQLRSAARVAPSAPNDLRSGRAAFLAAAAGLREAESAASIPQAAVLGALDAALERQAGGIEPAAGLEPSLAALVLPLVSCANDLRRQIMTVPPPPGGLKAGRDRFLNQAEAMRRQGRAAAVARPVARSAGGGGWAGLFGMALRLSASVAAALALFFGGTRALETSASQSLPGDLLYPVKRANEGLDLMLVAFDRQELRHLRAEQAGHRAQEIVQLAAAGRAGEHALTGAFLGLETVTTGGGERRGTLRLRVPAEGDPATVVEVAWDERSRFLLGDSNDPTRLVAGQAVQLRLRTLQGSDRPLLLSLEATGPLPVPTAPLQQATETTAPSGTPHGQTLTPVRPLSSRTPSFTARPPATATPAEGSPTTTAASQLTAQAPAAAATADRGISRMDGMVTSKSEAINRWTLREFNGAAAVDVDMSDVDPALRGGIAVGDAVRINYRRGTSPRRAVRIMLLQTQACPLQTAVGSLRSFDGDLLVLDDGRSFRVDRSARVVGDMRPGVEVSLSYRDCGSGALVESVEASAPSVFVGTGLVSGLTRTAEGIRFDLITDDGVRPITADGQTALSGRGIDHLAALIDGMLIRVIGSDDKSGLVRAGRIEVLALPEPTSPTETPEPTATRTPIPPTTEPTATVIPLPLPVDPVPPPNDGTGLLR